MEDTLRDLRVKSSGLLVVDDTILCTRHDDDWHRQLLIAVLHGDRARDHCHAVLTLRADLSGSYRHVWSRALREVGWHRERREHPLEQQRLRQSADER